MNLKRWVIPITLLAVLLLGTQVSASPFADMEQATWARIYVEKLSATGVIQGVGGNLFAPDRHVTKAEALTMVERLMGKEKEAQAQQGRLPFSDRGIVQPWSVPYLLEAIKLDLIPESTSAFSPNAPATRAEVASYVVHAASSDVPPADVPFSDLTNVSADVVRDTRKGGHVIVEKGATLGGLRG